MKLRSLTTLAVYWFALVAGLALFTVTRRDVDDLPALWIGVLGGTALGQFLAVRDLRLWFVAIILCAFVILCGPVTPMRDGGMLFWMAMIPATFCGWLSLSDRGSLLAFWLPVVLWMLTILDRGKGALQVDSGNAALLGGLAFVFFAFLYARETRRIDLWRHVSPQPIAPAAPPTILREVPRLALGTAGWSLAVSALAFAICAWLAPRLWHVEALVPVLHATAVETDVAAGTPGAPSTSSTTSTTTSPSTGLSGAPMCCHDLYLLRETQQARVKEYFDLGRGHDDDVDDELAALAATCVVCGPDNRPLDAGRLCDGTGCRPVLGSADGVPGGDGTDTGHGGAGDGAYGSLGYRSPGYTPPSTDPWTPAPTPTPTPTLVSPSTPIRAPTDERAADVASTTPTAPTAPPASTAPTAPTAPTASTSPTASTAPPASTASTAPTTFAAEPTPLGAAPTTLDAEPTPLGAAPTTLDAEPTPLGAAPTTLAAEPTPSDAAVTPHDAARPPNDPPQHPTQHPATAPVARASSAPPEGPPILAWVFVVLASGLALQLLALALRPIRRLVTLRHLRQPFWSETVDQRISNYWHLVLVGLRDAGWRTTSGEAPRALAKRLAIDGVERAASILERARHGVGIDATDLDEMSEAAEQAYRASRSRTSAVARFLGWFRRPLV